MTTNLDLEVAQKLDWLINILPEFSGSRGCVGLVAPIVCVILAWKTKLWKRIFFYSHQGVNWCQILEDCSRVCLTWIPVVVADGPRELGAEGEDQVEQRPGQDNNVGHTAVDEDQHPSIANPCRVRWFILSQGITSDGVYCYIVYM